MPSQPLPFAADRPIRHRRSPASPVANLFGASLSSVAISLANFCHKNGKALPKEWQALAKGVAKLCQRIGTMLAK